MRRDAREAADTATFADLTRVAVPWPAGLEVQWLGTAGYRLTAHGRTLLIDPYLTRVPLAQTFRRDAVLGDPELHDRYLAPDLDVVGILAGHTHFDHAIDIPRLTRRHDTTAYGSPSLAQLMRVHGLTERAVTVEPLKPYELGPFTVTFVPSLHSKLVLGYRVPYDGALTCDHLDGLCPSAYRCGEVYGIRIEVDGTTLYHQGSANLIDDVIPREPVDIFLAGIAGRSFTEDYWGRILRRLQPHTVVAGHFDDFFRPFGAKLGFTTNVNLTALPEEIAKVSRDIEVAALPLV